MSVLFFKMRYPNAVIRAFEPHPEIFAVLKRNVERNAFRSVTLNNEALLDEDSVVPFYLGSLGGSLGGSIRRVGDDSAVVEVQAGRLSDHLSSLEFVDLVKIDVEGAETEIVTDLQAAGLLSRPRRFIIEYHPERIGTGGVSLSDFIRTFENAGFSTETRGITATPTYLQSNAPVLLHFSRG